MMGAREQRVQIVVWMDRWMSEQGAIPVTAEIETLEGVHSAMVVEHSGPNEFGPCPCGCED